MYLGEAARAEIVDRLNGIENVAIGMGAPNGEQRLRELTDALRDPDEKVAETEAKVESAWDYLRATSGKGPKRKEG